MRFLFHFGTGIFHGDGEAAGSHGGQVDDVVAYERGFFGFEALLLHDFFEAGALVSNALTNVFEFQVAGAEHDSFRDARGDQPGLDAGEARERDRSAIVCVEAFHFDLTLSALRCEWRGSSLLRVFGQEEEFAIGEHAVNVEEEQFDFTRAGGGGELSRHCRNPTILDGKCDSENDVVIWYNLIVLEEDADMSLAAKKEFQNTTVRLPLRVYEQAKSVAVQSDASSFNEFIVQAIEEKVRRLTEAEIDAAFAQMANDTDYQRSSVALSGEFEKSDWEALETGTKHEQPKTRASKTRSR